jgi:dTDP-4-amino-4,6-dideoxygalactose transaminase
MQPQIHVTRPSLAPLEEYIPYLETIWETGIMTHNGPMVRRLEKKLKEYLKAKHVICVSNGTCALQLAIRALNLTGEIITTPFTFIATANIIAWERCRPVFVDISADTWNIDSQQIEAAVTDKTTAILPVHVFSSPCDVNRIQSIADKYKLSVIYDAAHAIGVEIGGESILHHGDMACVSLHATKLFNAAEGGICVTNDDVLPDRIRRMRFFGFDDNKDIVDIGMNAKMTEVSAALGLVNLNHLNRFKQCRRERYELYLDLLSRVPLITFQKFNPEEYNYCYMPILFESESLLLRAMRKLTQDNIYARRYFYPSLNTVSIFAPQAALPVSERIARSILCLPLYDTLEFKDIERICHCISNG